LAFSRAPTSTLLENSASAPTSATVFGVGVIDFATSKNAFDRTPLESGPNGALWKYFGYLNSALEPSANSTITIFLRSMICGIAATIRLVACPITRSTLSTSISLA
jgi:hypothetical protein